VEDLCPAADATGAGREVSASVRGRRPGVWPAGTGAVAESFTALDTASAGGPSGASRTPLVQGAGASARAVRSAGSYVTVELLIRRAALPAEIRCHLIQVWMIMLV
jgi:hypothetical protein